MQSATTNGGPAPGAYFSQTLEGHAAGELGGGGPLGWLRSVRHWLWLRLGPLGADVSVASRALFGGDPWAPRGVSSVEPKLLGEPLAYYDDGSRVLRVVGRVLPAAPPGRARVA